MKNYGQVIAKLRKKHNLTQEQLGKMLNVSYQAVSKWENNLSEPDLATIEKITEIFNVSISEFFLMAQNIDDVNKQNDVKEKVDLGNKNFIKEKPWYLVFGMSILIVILFLCAFLIPIKYTASQIYKMVDDSVFCIKLEGINQQQAGTGFFINDKGLAVTNYHVIENSTSGEIQLNNGKTYNVEKVIGVDEDKDIAIIKIDIKKSKPVKIGNSDKISVGDTVYAIGYPESFVLGNADSTFTKGIISKTSYTYEGNSYIQTTVDITHGNSGGVLINERGEVIGITSAMITDGTIDYMNMAIPINKIESVKRNLNVSLKGYYDMHKTFNFYSNGNKYHSQEYVSGGKITKPSDPIRNGYTFGGWYTDLTYTIEFDFNSPIINEVGCYAKWIPNTYTIKFNSNGGNGTMEDIIATYDKGVLLPLNTFTKPNYLFKGWSIQGFGDLYEENKILRNLTSENNAIVYMNAEWQMINYTINFDGNGAETGTLNNITVRYDEEITLPENVFTKTGYIFDGWLYNGITYDELETVSMLSNTQGEITLEAKWKPIKYIVRFTYDGNSYDQEFIYDVAQTLKPNEFVRENCHFSYWINKSVPIHYLLLNEDNVINLTSIDGDVIILNAEFEENYYYIRYNPSSEVDLENSYTERMYYSKETTIWDHQFRKTGYRLKYFVDKEGNIYKLNTTIQGLVNTNDEIIDFFAVWEEITYYVYYTANYNDDRQYEWVGGVKYSEEFTLDECPFTYEGYVFSHYEYNSIKYMPGDIVSKLEVIKDKSVYIEAIFVPIT